jgi:DNA polymerase elongation subunit (family B)
MGTKDINDEKYVEEQIHKYLDDAEYWHTLNLKMPTFKYMKFLTERDMLEYFLKNIVAKVSVIAGWNSLLFDWQYIQNRIKNYYSDLNFACCSYNYTISRKN